MNINYNNCVSEKGSGIWSVVDDCDGDGLNRFVLICIYLYLFLLLIIIIV